MSGGAKHILITGGGRGIGRRMVDGFLAQGMSVIVLERDPDLVLELNGLLNCTALACDVTDDDAISTSMQLIIATGRVPDVLINNAGWIHSSPLVNVLSKEDRVHSRRDWKNVLAANLDSVFLVTSRLVDQLMVLRRTAVVVSLSSISARGNPGQTAYSAAKAGVEALTKTWARELGPLGFRFAAIAPGFLDTHSTRQALSKSKIEELRCAIPVRDLGSVEHVFQAAQFVIENDYVNGSVLEVDGGMVL